MCSVQLFALYIMYMYCVVYGVTLRLQILVASKIDILNSPVGSNFSNFQIFVYIFGLYNNNFSGYNF